MVISESKAIRKKLMAATSMLLVACIMLISASYAWFTLSTAPEVTGITTAVGANGNLEIALADLSTWDDPNTEVGTTVTGSTMTTQQANITWGNLVDVSEGYGLDKITLLPSRLSVASMGTDSYKVNVSPLLTPSYGNDGRVSELQATTDFAKANASGTFEKVSLDADRGVRGIGAAAGMTERQIAYRTAKNTLANATEAAKVNAKASLEVNGTALASIIMGKALETADAPVAYTADDLAVLEAVISAVSTAQAKLIEGWKAAVIGYIASAAGEALVDDEIKFNAFKGAIENNNFTVAEDGTLSVSVAEVTLNQKIGDLGTYYTKAVAVGTKINTAAAGAQAMRDQVTAGTATTFGWTEFSPVLNAIVDSDNVTINGFTKSTLKENIGALASAAMSTGIQVQMPSGAGVYADIADFCGNYSAGVTLEDLVYNGTEIGDLPATMTTTSAGPAYYKTLSDTVAAAGAPVGAGSANNVLTDMYGYAIDFYLRTNAANSDLLLQVDEAQRIYSESDNVDTQGGGSNMTFTSSHTDFTSKQMQDLMKALRVVFMDANNNILGIAVLDMAKAEVENTTVKADLKLCKYTFNKAEGSDECTTISILDADTSDDGTTQADFDFLTSQKITSLPQNQATKVTAMVYLDGDLVTNAMVANALTSMTGAMNLQFASSAELVPMTDTALSGSTNE